MPDPKLQTAMEEIKVILRKHDIAAGIVLVSPTHSEYLHEITPSWSCASWENLPAGRALRFRALASEYQTKEAHRAALSGTIGMFQSLDTGCRTLINISAQILRMVGERVEFHVSEVHEKGDGTPLSMQVPNRPDPDVVITPERIPFGDAVELLANKDTLRLRFEQRPDSGVTEESTMTRPEVVELLTSWSAIYRSGPMARSTGFGLYICTSHVELGPGQLFIQTDEPPDPATRNPVLN